MPEAGNGSKYDVCLSFAGEQREYVEQVAACLHAADVRIFYDRYQTVELWGRDLVQGLDDVFRGQARFCVMFVSAEYAAKVWTSHERRSAQARAVESAGTYILPVRFDQTEIPGLPGSVVYLNAAEVAPRQLAELIIEKIRENSPSPVPVRSAVMSPVLTNQPYSMAPVIGRGRLLDELSDGFFHTAETTRTPALRVLTGIGGMGKTSVARAYGERNNHRYDLVWWIRAESPELAIEDFRELLVALGVPEVQRLERPVHPAHLLLANRQGRWLLVFDNVPGQSALRGLVPPHGIGDVIVTSRTQAWPDPRAVLPVPPLTADAGSALLCDTSRDEDPSAALALVEELGGLPLALHQAGSYVAENPIGLAEYLSLYQSHRSRLHQLGTAPDYDLRVSTTWEVSFQMIPENAQTVLNVLAWMSPERVPLDLLRQDHPVENVPTAVAERVNAAFATDLDYYEAVSALSGYGLITVSGRDATVHRLISAATRDNTEPVGDGADWADATAALLLAAVPRPPANADKIETWLRLRPHVEHHLRSTPSANSEQTLRLHHWNAQWAGEVGRPSEALKLFEALIPRQVAVLGGAHPDTLRSRHSQAQWTGEAGDFSEAVALFDEVAESWRATSGPDHPEALRALHSSAYWLVRRAIRTRHGSGWARCSPAGNERSVPSTPTPCAPSTVSLSGQARAVTTKPPATCSGSCCRSAHDCSAPNTRTPCGPATASRSRWDAVATPRRLAS
ncbi:ATP-binding protein [Lentzea sp. NBRC 102530]|nr:TIR domain-containing protein [Lentzea sp. NBRC 102530]GLY50187.1 ATP-binding protein [Lentzea sp. NBRC 102530]